MTQSFGVFENEELVAGDEESRRRARDDLRGRRLLHLAENSRWRRINLDDLRFSPHTIEDCRTGEQFKRYRGELLDAVNLPVVAWYIGSNGEPVFLEAGR